MMRGSGRQFPLSAVHRFVADLVYPAPLHRCSPTMTMSVRRGKASSSSSSSLSFGLTRDMCGSGPFELRIMMRHSPVSSSLSPRRRFSTTETAGTGTPSGHSGTGDDEATSGVQGDERRSEHKETLEAEIKLLKDQLLRSYADQENTRTIAKRDVVEARQYAIKSFAKSLLEVADNLQRALDSVNAQDVGSSPQLQTLFDGIQMTNVGLLKALSSNGVKKYCEVPGDKFDPSLHSALMQYPDPDKETGTVGQVITVGFTLNDRVLRPAEVGVVKNA